MPAEEPFWADGGKGLAGDGSEESLQRRGLLELTSLNVPAWIKQPALHCAHSSETKRGLLQPLSVEDPIWFAGGRRKDGELGEKPQRRGGLLDSLSADKTFWAPRGKKESLLMTSSSAEELLSQVSTH
jgi:hypothetical protein